MCASAPSSTATLDVQGTEPGGWVRFCAHAVFSVGCWLALQVAHLNVPGSELYRKLRQLKAEKGGLTSQDERHFAQIRRSLEAEVLAHADVVRGRADGAGHAISCNPPASLEGWSSLVFQCIYTAHTMLQLLQQNRTCCRPLKVCQSCPQQGGILLSRILN